MTYRLIKKRMSKFFRLRDLYADKYFQYMSSTYIGDDNQPESKYYKLYEKYYDLYYVYDEILTAKVKLQIQKEFNNPTNTLTYNEVVSRKLKKLGWGYLDINENMPYDNDYISPIIINN